MELNTTTEHLSHKFPYAHGVAYFWNLLTVFAFWKIASQLQSFICSRLEAAEVEATVARFLSRVVQWALVSVAAITCLSTIGINTTTLSALITAVGVSIGFAFKGSLSHLAAGVMLLIFEPFKVGDFVSINGHQGTIFEIDLFVTRLDTPDNQRIVVPNNAIFGTPIKNYSHHKLQRLDIDINVAVDVEIDETHSLLEEAISGIESNGAPEVALIGLTDDVTNWQVRVWAERKNIKKVKEQVISAVKKKLDSQKIKSLKKIFVQMPGENWKG
eukprot:TRINITY_DN666_c0_g2_i2.p1 TRINITY_DN666_c0_g2~~TRINITY_DN666_c0_g2_i2.p1  ORF type:complete len:272 (+),score=54.76 TRINITY_DN666_c0_g2_i2:41-856(+)